MTDRDGDEMSHYTGPRDDMLEVWCPEMDEEVGLNGIPDVSHCPMCGDDL